MVDMLEKQTKLNQTNNNHTFLNVIIYFIQPDNLINKKVEVIFLFLFYHFHSWNIPLVLKVELQK